jgi:hypothetical protein
MIQQHASQVAALLPFATLCYAATLQVAQALTEHADGGSDKEEEEVALPVPEGADGEDEHTSDDEQDEDADELFEQMEAMHKGRMTRSSLASDLTGVSAHELDATAEEEEEFADLTFEQMEAIHLGHQARLKAVEKLKGLKLFQEGAVHVMQQVKVKNAFKKGDREEGDGDADDADADANVAAPAESELGDEVVESNEAQDDHSPAADDAPLADAEDVVAAE